MNKLAKTNGNSDAIEQILDRTETMLSVHGGGVVQTPAVPVALATISAGRKTKSSSNSGADRPMKSKAGEWYIHNTDGMGYGLVEFFQAKPADKLFPDVYMVEPRDGKPVSLTVAFPSDNPDEVFRSYFIKRTAQRVELFGDETQLTRFIVRDPQKRLFDTEVYPAGTEEYKKYLTECKVECFAYFALADWGWDGERYNPQTLYPDGLGVYRLRFTSVNAHKNLKAMLRQIAIITGGKLAGVPLELFLQKRQLTQPGGWQGTEWIWTLRFNPPQPQGQQMRLSLPQLRTLALEGTRAGGILALPSGESDVDWLLEESVAEASEEMTEAEVANVQSGFNPQTIRDEYFARVEGTPYAEDIGRGWLVSYLTRGEYPGLSELFKVETGWEFYDQFLHQVEASVAQYRGLLERINRDMQVVAELYRKSPDAVHAQLHQATGYTSDEYDLGVLERSHQHLEQAIIKKRPVDAKSLQKLID